MSYRELLANFPLEWRLTREEAMGLIALDDLDMLLKAAARRRDAAHGELVSYSRKVFIPLTQLCRDVCHYCTFAHPPRKGQKAFLTREEVLVIAEAGKRAGCKEALFTLGDKPEMRYRLAREELAALGHETTISYLAEMAELVFRETGLLPHINPGLLSAEDLASLRKVSISQGIMLESASERLHRKGGAHYGSPDKLPAARLETIRLAGEAAVPFTSGILIGIGETREERIDSLLALRDLNDRYGHLQEIIVQNFRPKPGTRMAAVPAPKLEDHLWTIAMARLLFGPGMNIQAPPNLNPGALGRLVEAGINDWGGVSPVTPDHVNPEAPWPHLLDLAEATRAAGKMLVERLAIYPAFARAPERWVDPSLRFPLYNLVDADGWPRTDSWCPGRADELPEADIALLRRAKSPPPPSNKDRAFAQEVMPPHPAASRPPSPRWGEDEGAGVRRSLSPRGEGARANRRAGEGEYPVICANPLHNGEGNLAAASHGIRSVLDKAGEERPLAEADIVTLFRARGDDFAAVCRAADDLRRRVNGDIVSYVVTRNINYTNICYFKCQFCAFSKGKMSENLRGRPYDLELEEVGRRVSEAWERGASEVCMQGGIHPSYTGERYLSLCRAVKEAVPSMHMHAFSPLEVSQGAKTLGLSVPEFLAQLKAAGLNTLPGTAAEILDDEVRAVLCADKIKTREWLDIMRAAHRLGFRSTATIMFGHVERYEHWARHLIRIRDLQAETGGFTEFVPLPFVHMEAPIYLKKHSRPGPTFRESVLMHAVARLALHPHITNIQASWVKLGPDGVRQCLDAGVNDLGGTLMDESISRSAGASHGQEMTPQHMEELILGAGRLPRLRTTLYADATAAQRQKAFAAASARQSRSVLQPAFAD
ncbi:MAG TPA: 5-amino-6-(D-ribitylamino)uracil--L-tyrosine 4-hydroxyphenyl transferase CofH [Rhizobiaceae bacterium]|nr:5-amino-6-(D-ribitylamino)uracil--L-tyrosine 4-hydroxyphenyl transferase CofH [Rhizobiaceae bacterium]